ncbi:MAG: helix-turn-helix transcriptional regulator [Clostridiales bacterium]|nr:helix-turn-helix transcriptional regulator [Clostridiales bacterium]
MRLVYTKPKLKDLSQGSRIAFVRQFRMFTQDDVSDKLGLTGECKRRTMTRYETGERNPKFERLKEIAEILNVNINSIKFYDYKEPLDIIYTLMWLEELLPNYNVDLYNVPNINEDSILLLKRCITEWNYMKLKRAKREISYQDYIEWKLNYSIFEGRE